MNYLWINIHRVRSGRNGERARNLGKMADISTRRWRVKVVMAARKFITFFVTANFACIKRGNTITSEFEETLEVWELGLLSYQRD